jgi:nucleotide-binding universal stress UspA family protein
MRPIVVGIDGSEQADAALLWAADDAVRRGRPLRIVRVREPWVCEHPVIATPGHERWLSEHDNELLAAAARRVRDRAPGLELSTALVVGAVVPRLVDAASGADSVVLGSRGLGGFAGLVLGSVGMGVAGCAPGAVVIVGGPQGAAPGGRVALGYDGSRQAEAAMEYALEQALARRARLLVVYAWREPAFEPLVPYVPYEKIMNAVFEDNAAQIGERLAPWRDKHPDLDLVYLPVCGHPVRALAEVAGECDLVVVGSCGLGEFGAAMLGSVSHGVLHHVRCPVAVVRPPAARDAAGDAAGDEV